MKPTMPIIEALGVLRSSLKNGTPVPANDWPTSLRRNEIARMISVFQPRQLDGRLAEDEAHVRTLCQAIGSPERPRYLDPIQVWWGGDRWYVIDGHHRLLAYDRLGITDDIPVVVFDGDLDAAMAQSAAANSKDRLVMRSDDKLNYAWRLTIISNLSKIKVVDACAVANGTVGKMRKVKAALLADGQHTEEDLLDLPWKDALAEAEGREKDVNYNPEEAIKRRAERYRVALFRALGDRPYNDPEAFGLALLHLDSRFPERLMRSESWSGAVRQAVRNLAEDDREAAELDARWNAAEDEDY